MAAALGLLGWKNRESLVSVLKWLKGKKPEHITQIGNAFELVLFGQKKVISQTVNIFMNDPPLRQALARTVAPLRQPGIDRLHVRPRNAELNVEPTTIEKDDAKYLEADPLQLAPQEVPDEGTREATLIITKLSFIEGQKWAFLERGATVVAEIDDDEFWKSVHEGKYRFAEGDQLSVRLYWRVIHNKGKPKAENTITKVYQIVPRRTQMRLDGATDDAI
ncbi:MAG: hypothetical protein ACR2IF_04500 [Terriglobales bacterium]